MVTYTHQTYFCFLLSHSFNACFGVRSRFLAIWGLVVWGTAAYYSASSIINHRLHISHFQLQQTTPSKRSFWYWSSPLLLSALPQEYHTWSKHTQRSARRHGSGSESNKGKGRKQPAKAENAAGVKSDCKCIPSNKDKNPIQEQHQFLLQWTGAFYIATLARETAWVTAII